MSNDDNRPRRDMSRPEDNPFIAFRRFADSQVSSLLNTVFTLPATIANYNNAHLAREECLFGKGDKKQCEKLRVIEDEITALRHEGRESFRIGDVQAVLRASEELMRLDREADGLRKGIVGDTTTTNDGRHGEWRDERMIEQFANRKGQEWGWMWDWGFPRPFDYDNSSRDVSECQRDNEMREAEAILRLQSEVQKLVAAFDGKTWDDRDDQMKDEPEPASDDGRPRVWSWSRSWQWPPPADAGREEYSPRALESDHQLRKTGIPWQEAYEDLLREEHRPSSSHAPDEPSYEYAHDHEDQHDDPPTPKTMQAARFPVHQGAVPERDSKEVGSIAEEVFQKVLEMQHQERSGQATRMLQEEDKTANRLALPLPEDEASEMDAYEHLQLQEATSQVTSSAVFLEKHAHESNTRSSILSTLTTTERTVAPDGSVTTKTILKKRFADGKEESSETVHVQHIHDTENPSQPARSKTPSDLGSTKGEDVQKRKRPSWFWSS